MFLLVFIVTILLAKVSFTSTTSLRKLIGETINAEPVSNINLIFLGLKDFKRQDDISFIYSSYVGFPGTPPKNPKPIYII